MQKRNQPGLSDRSNEPPKFAGIHTFLNLHHSQRPEDLKESDFAVVGVPFDTGVTYRVGARFAPSAIRSISGSIRPFNPVLQVAPTEVLNGLDYGDAPIVPGNTERSMERIRETIGKIVKYEALPVCLGGDHSISLPILRALAPKYGPLALVHFDSHPDTWPEVYGEKYNHATPFMRAYEEGLIAPEKSIQLGIRGTFRGPGDLEANERIGFTVITAEQLLDMSSSEVGRRVKETVGEHPVYLSFDIDFLDPAYAPGTGTPEIGGPTSAQALAYIRRLSLEQLKGVDVVEVLPSLDPSEITALAAATVIFEILSVVAAGSK